MKIKKYAVRFACIFILITGLMSCQTARKNATSSGGFDYYNQSAEGAFEIDALAKQEASLPSKTENKQTRKVIYQARLNFEVDSVRPSKVITEQIMKAYQGYLLQSNNNSMQIRVPAKDLEKAIIDLKKIGKLTYENISGEDVTDNYYDIQLRLDNAEKTRTRYLELLEQAKDVSEILKVEKELERLNEKIERYKGSMKSYNQQIEYSLITVYFQVKADKVRPGPLGYVFVGVYKAVKWLFVWD